MDLEATYFRLEDMAEQKVPEDPMNEQKETLSHPDVLAAYVRLWAVQQVVEVILDQVSCPYAFVVLGITVFAAWLPTVPLVFGAHVAVVVQFLVHMPAETFAAQYWNWLTNLGGLLVLAESTLKHMFSKGFSNGPKTTFIAERHAIAAEYAAVVRMQYIILWMGTACWKMTDGFLDSRGSCAPILQLQLLQLWWPQSLMDVLGGPRVFAKWIVRNAAGSTLAIELAIPCLLFWPGRLRCLGVAVAAFLFLFIVFVPFPNYAALFSTTVATRLFMFLPESSATALAEIWQMPGQLLQRVAQVVGGVPSEVLPSHDSTALIFTITCLSKWDWISEHFFPNLSGTTADIPLYLGLILILGRALWLEARGNCCECISGARSLPSPLPRQRFVRAAAFGVVFTYTFLGPVLGFMDVGTPNIYSHLAVHGGSNHLFLPTGLLQAAFADGDPAINPFAGGEVRVDQTNSTYVLALYPAEVTGQLSEDVIRLLHLGGHVGREWLPSTAFLSGPDSVGGGGGFTPYRLPALEFRRTLTQARQHQKPFSLSYTRLAAPLWDPGNSLAKYQVQYEEDGHGGHRCFITGSGPCTSDELVLLQGPAATWLGWFALKVTVSNAIPELAGGPRFPCFC